MTDLNAYDMHRVYARRGGPLPRDLVPLRGRLDLTLLAYRRAGGNLTGLARRSGLSKSALTRALARARRAERAGASPEPVTLPDAALVWSAARRAEQAARGREIAARPEIRETLEWVNAVNRTPEGRARLARPRSRRRAAA